MKKPIVLWLTGLSGSGKTTIAERLASHLKGRYPALKLLDGDAIRSTIHSHLSFTPDDIKKNNELVARWCITHCGNHDLVIVSMISPFTESRNYARRVIGNSFIEIYIKATLEEVIRRDVKGLYKKAIEGKIDNFIGIAPNVPYQTPEDAEIVLDTQKESIEECVEKVLNYLEGAKSKDFK